MKKIIETVAEGGGELGVHMYPFLCETFHKFTFFILVVATLVCVASSCMSVSHMQAFSFHLFVRDSFVQFLSSIKYKSFPKSC